MFHQRSSDTHAFTPAALLVLALVSLPSGAPGQECPVGGVLDDQRAYFGTTLSPNVCESADARCEDVFFFSRQSRTTAICDDGRWRPLDEAGAGALRECPRFVFSPTEVWQGGDYAANVCSEATASRCPSAFFHRLPEGGSGYRPAACIDGRWSPDPDGGRGPQPASSRLRGAGSSNELVTYLREGLKQTYGGENPYLYAPWGTVGGPSGQPSDPGGGGGGADVPLSDTNVQEAGVDEEDRIESDGRMLYVLKNGQSLEGPPTGPPSPPRIRILEIDPETASAGAVSDLEVAIDDGQRARGIYLRESADQLVLTASNIDLGWAYWYSPLAWLDAQSTIASIDVTDPAAPFLDAALSLDGDILSSRRIGDVLYVASRFQPRIPGLEPFQPGGAGAVEALGRIESAQLEQLLPLYRSSAGGSARLLVEPERCYLPPQGSPIRTADVISLLAIDLESMSVVSSRCFVGAAETLYVSLRSIYLASTRYEYTFSPDPGFLGMPWIDYGDQVVETDLHKFSLEDGRITYEASGVVDGHLGFDILRRQFRLSELDDDLRVVTYTDEITPDRSPVALTVLRDDGDELAVVSRLPNARHPEPIGKPGEELYATRFVGDRAYLVTFLITDPLYVIDLSDPLDPVVAGELEITGYSDYLHPLEGGYLLGVGKDAIPDPTGDFRGAWYQGLKVSLFDVGDPANPSEVDSIIVGKRGSDSPVLRDHRAFTFLQPVEGNLRFAIGAKVHERSEPPQNGEPWNFFGWSYSGLQLFEVDTTNARILRRGEMRVEEYRPSIDGGSWPIEGDDRTVLAGEAVFYLHGDEVYSGFWSNPWVFEGPE